MGKIIFDKAIFFLFSLSVFVSIPGFSQTITSISPNPACNTTLIEIVTDGGYSNRSTYALIIDGNLQVPTVDYTRVVDTFYFQLDPSFSVGSHVITVECCGGAQSDDSTLTILPETDASFTGYGLMCSDVLTAYSPMGLANSGVASTWTTSVGGATAPGAFFANTGQIKANNVAWPLNTPFEMRRTTTGGTCPDTDTVLVTITETDDGNFEYDNGNNPANFCRNDFSPFLYLTDTAPNPGFFSFSSSDIYLVDTAFGVINLDSTIGSTTVHDVTYITNGTCPDTVVKQIQIKDYRDAYFEYPVYSFCKPYVGNGKEQPINLQHTGGDSWAYSGGTSTTTPPGPVGLDLDTGDGEIDIDDNSTYFGSGYIITRTTSSSGSLCSDIYAITVSITKQDTPVFVFGDTVFCPGDPAVLPDTIITTGSSNSFTSATIPPAGLNGTTGELTPSAIPVGTHQIILTTSGACGGDTANYITVKPGDNASFTLPRTRFCINEIQSDSAIKTAITDTGFFSINPPAAIDPNSGSISIGGGGATPGFYDITYTTIDSCPNSFTIPIEIYEDDADFHYPDTVYCINDVNDPMPFLFGNAGGKFTEISSTLVIDSLSGRINLDSATAGIFTIKYKTGSSCPDSTTFNIEILSRDTATFGYNQSTYCYSDSIAIISIRSDSSDGTFSELTNSIIIDDSTGEVDVQNSPPGIYMIKYVSNGICIDSSSQIITIYRQKTANFDYTRDRYCQQDDETRPTIFGDGGGFFSCSDTSLALDSITGEITPFLSQVGGYSVNYTTPGPCAVTFSDSVYIDLEAPSGFTFQLGIDEFCQADTNPLPVLDTLVPTNGTWYSNSPGLAIVDSVTGRINLPLSTPGTYSLTYELNLGAGSCLSSTTRQFTVLNPTDTTFFTYPDTVFCQTRTSISPSLTGQGGGFYFVDNNSNDSLLVFNNPDLLNRSGDGRVDIWNTPPGIYTVFYDIPNTCSDDTSFTFRIVAVDTPSFSYDTTIFCQDFEDPYPTVNSVVGTFSSEPAGVVFKATIFPGNIDLGLTPPGTYDIVYTTQGICPDTIRQELQINSVPIPILASDVANEEICDGDSINFEALGVNIFGNNFTFLLNDTTVLKSAPEDNKLEYLGAVDNDVITVIVTNSDQCSDSSSLGITVHPIPGGGITRADTVISSDTPMEVDLTSDVPDCFFHWEMFGSGDLDPDSVVNQLIGPADSGGVVTIFQSVTLGSDFYPVSVTFYVQPEAYGCWGPMDSVTVNVNPNEEDIFVPGILTPNNDLLNDTWQIQVRTGVDPSRYVMLVLNRSGGVAHTMTPLNSDWTGGDLPEGVYWFVLKKRDTNEIIKRGGLTIRRR